MHGRGRIDKSGRNSPVEMRRPRVPAVRQYGGDLISTSKGLAMAALRRLTCLAALAVAAIASTPELCRANPFLHVTDGVFTSPDEWTGPGVNQTFFAFNPATNAGGAYLYVEQGFSGITPTEAGIPNTLFLMYDYVSSAEAGFSVVNSFYDVFFSVPALGDDYVVRIFGQDNFLAVEKEIGTVSSLNPDGTFNLEDPVWSPLDSDDLAIAKFQTAIGFGTSPNSGSPHLMAEFQLSINTGAFSGGPSTGFYDPAPAFWSASVGKEGSDPPISSAIFTLNPDGSTIVAPALGPNGDPVQQPQQVVPEPSTLAMVGTPVMIGLIGFCRRKRPTA
jgi:hypothetical protein